MKAIKRITFIICQIQVIYYFSQISLSWISVKRKWDQNREAGNYFIAITTAGGVFDAIDNTSINGDLSIYLQIGIFYILNRVVTSSNWGRFKAIHIDTMHVGSDMLLDILDIGTHSSTSSFGEAISWENSDN